MSKHKIRDPKGGRLWRTAEPGGRGLLSNVLLTQHNFYKHSSPIFRGKRDFTGEIFFCLSHFPEAKSESPFPSTLIREAMARKPECMAGPGGASEWVAYLLLSRYS